MRKRDNLVMSLKNQVYILEELVKKGIKLKYRRSYLGMLWTVLEPLMTTIVLTIVFGVLYDTKGADYPMYILCGRLLYNVFSMSTKTAARSIRVNSSIIKKVYVPKYLYPLAAVLQNFFTFMISLVVIIPLAIYCHISFSWHMLQGIIPIFFLLIFTIGLSFILATITVFVRDMEPLWDVICMMIMYCCAIFYYPEKLLESSFGFVLKYNPVYQSIAMFRDAMFGNAMNFEILGFLAISSFACLIIGIIVFRKNQDKFILYV